MSLTTMTDLRRKDASVRCRRYFGISDVYGPRWLSSHASRSQAHVQIHSPPEGTTNDHVSLFHVLVVDRLDIIVC